MVLHLLLDNRRPVQVIDAERSLRRAIGRADQEGDLDLSEMRKYRRSVLFWTFQRLLHDGLVQREPLGYVLTHSGTETAEAIPKSATVKKILAHASS